MTAKTATYATILPDDIDPIGFNQPMRRQFSESSSGAANKSSKLEDSSGPAGQPTNASGQGGDDLSKHIGSNNRLTYGLLVVIAILLIAIGYQAYQQKKRNSEAAKPQPMTEHVQQSGNQPPPNSGGQTPTQKPTITADHPHSGQQMNQMNQSAIRNDRILRQAQQKSACVQKPRGQSAMNRRNNGCTDADDKRRLETIIEDSEAMDDADPIQEQVRAAAAAQMLQDIENKVGDEPLGTGSVGGSEFGTYASRPEVDMDDRDEALVEPGNANMEHLGDDDTADDASISTEQVAVMCSQILAHGSRAGQECGRDCRPGKNKCERHFAMAAKKSNQS